MDLLMEAVEDALNGKRDSDRLDAGILQILVKTRAIFERGSTKLRIARSDKVVEFDVSAVRTFQGLADAMPTPRVDRVQGVLDSLTMSTRTLVLKLDDGTTIRGGVGTPALLDVLKGLFGKGVVLEGTVSFHPSGRPQRIEVDYVAEATDRDLIWARAPRSDVLAVASGDMKSLLGQWPGDESDEQVLASLKALS
jgi:hypothetical protein